MRLAPGLLANDRLSWTGPKNALAQLASLSGMMKKKLS